MRYLRRLLERIARNRVIKRHILVNGRRGSIYVSPDSQLKYFKFGKGAFDHDLIEIVETYIHEGDNVWDIGANVGVFTFASVLKNPRGQVLSVEADIWLCGILRRTAALKDYAGSDIRVIPVAASSKPGISSFLLANRGRAMNALEEAGGRSCMGGTREKQYVPSLALDQLLGFCNPPDFIKIDVEGAELLVLDGAKKVLSEVRPKVFIEVNSETVDEVTTIFKSHNYAPLQDNHGDGATRGIQNLLFVPLGKSR